MSGLLLGTVLSVRTFWFNNMVTVPSLFVSADFGTWSYQCSFIIIIIIWRHTKYPDHGPESDLVAKADNFVIVLFLLLSHIWRCVAFILTFWMFTYIFGCINYVNTVHALYSRTHSTSLASLVCSALVEAAVRSKTNENRPFDFVIHLSEGHGVSWPNHLASSHNSLHIGS
jgi:hypothetical protein